MHKLFSHINFKFKSSFDQSLSSTIQWYKIIILLNNNKKIKLIFYQTQCRILKKLIFINSFIYDKVMFEKFNFDNYINNSLIDIEFWRLNFDQVIDKKNFEEKNRLEHEEKELIKQKNIEKFKK